VLRVVTRRTWLLPAPVVGGGNSTQKPPLPGGKGGLACGEERGSGVGLAAVVGGVALAGAALAGALAHVCSKWGRVVVAVRAHDPTQLWHINGQGGD
jgi:hypothetical protein